MSIQRPVLTLAFAPNFSMWPMLLIEVQWMRLSTFRLMMRGTSSVTS